MWAIFAVIVVILILILYYYYTSTVTPTYDPNANDPAANAATDTPSPNGPSGPSGPVPSGPDTNNTGIPNAPDKPADKPNANIPWSSSTTPATRLIKPPVSADHTDAAVVTDAQTDPKKPSIADNYKFDPKTGFSAADKFACPDASARNKQGKNNDLCVFDQARDAMQYCSNDPKCNGYITDGKKFQVTRQPPATDPSSAGVFVRRTK